MDECVYVLIVIKINAGNYHIIKYLLKKLVNIGMCINFTKNIIIMTTKLVYLIRLRSSKNASVRVGLSCQSEDTQYICSTEMAGSGNKISDVLNRLNSHQLIQTNE